MGNALGYARITTSIPESYEQLNELNSAGCSTIFVDYVSGPTDARPELAKALKALAGGDTLVVTRLDRPGRSLQHILTLVDGLVERGVGLRILSGSLDSQTPDGKLLFPVFASLSEMERDMVHERYLTQPASTKAGGRPPLLTHEQSALARHLYAQGDLTVAEIGGRLGVSRTTVYRALDTKEEKPQERRRTERCPSSPQAMRQCGDS